MAMEWWALAMVFASLPGICFVCYSYQCGYLEQRRSIRGYGDILRSIYRAKREGQKEASRVLAGHNAPLFSLLLTLILFLMPKETPLIITVNVASIPTGELAVWLGRRNRIADGIPLSQAKNALEHLPPKANLRETIAIVYITALWVAIVGLVFGVNALCSKAPR
jgi:hypothetical protein